MGSLRLALINWVHAKKHNGKFLLRIEDTDTKRSSQKMIDYIYQAFAWIGIKYNDKPIIQTSRSSNHIETVNSLLAKGKAYWCFDSSKTNHNIQHGYRSPYRSLNATKNTKGVVRFKVPENQDTSFTDKIHGKISVNNEQVEDFIILRSDNTVVYNLAVVVDDCDMKITNVIRGDDHITNTIKQIMIYNAMNWDIPDFAHIPLLFSPDGRKLSKRNDAMDVLSYKKVGFFPEALATYLINIGTENDSSSLEATIRSFCISKINTSPAKFDIDKLKNINASYMLSTPYLEEYFTRFLADSQPELGENKLKTLVKGIHFMKKRASTMSELFDLSQYLIERPVIDPKFQNSINTEILSSFHLHLSNAKEERVKEIIKVVSKETDSSTKSVYESLRISITGTMSSAGIIDIINILGKQEVLKRIKSIIPL